MKFTTSWDDGHPLDLRIGDLLTKHGCTGTFYIPKAHDRVPTPLTDKEILELSKKHEIGAHGITHKDLPTLSDNELHFELTESKKWIESILHKKCLMFCYPRGLHKKREMEAVKKAGYKGARTTEIFAFKTGNRFALGSSLHVNHFPFRPIANRRCIDPIKRHWPHLNAMQIPVWKRRNWLTVATATFTKALQNNVQWFHLRGHSWELERNNMWGDLEKFLTYVSRHPVEHVINSDLL